MSAGPTLKGIDHRYGYVRIMYEAGQLPAFMDIFKHVPKTVVARDMNMKVDAFNKLLQFPDRFSLERIDELAQLVDMELDVMVAMWLRHYREWKKTKTSGDELH